MYTGHSRTLLKVSNGILIGLPDEKDTSNKILQIDCSFEYVYYTVYTQTMILQFRLSTAPHPTSSAWIPPSSNVSALFHEHSGSGWAHSGDQSLHVG